MPPDDAGSPERLDEFDELEEHELVLGDLLNRVLDKGLVISGHVTIAVADIDLVALDLRLLLSSVQSALERPARRGPDGHLPLLFPHPPRR